MRPLGITQSQLAAHIGVPVQRINEIAGFDPGRPALSQLDKLTDAQIVEIARAMDPWAQEPDRR